MTTLQICPKNKRTVMRPSSELAGKLYAVSSLFNTQLLIFLPELAMPSFFSPTGEIFYLLFLFTPFPPIVTYLVLFITSIPLNVCLFQAIVLNYLVAVPFSFCLFIPSCAFFTGYLVSVPLWLHAQPTQQSCHL